MNALILLRGLPGSGKSTLANELSEAGTYPVYGIDDYFTDSVSGTYFFEYEKNHLAYKQCEERAEKSMQQGVKKILIANTFTLDWELEPYFKLAQRYAYRVFVVTVENYHGTKNIHQIPDEQVRKMSAKYKVKLL